MLYMCTSSDSTEVDLGCNGDAKQHITSNLSTPSPMTGSPGSDDGLLNDNATLPKQDVPANSDGLLNGDATLPKQDVPANSSLEKNPGTLSQSKEVQIPLEAISNRPHKTVAQSPSLPQTQDGCGVGTSHQAKSSASIVSQPVSQLSTPYQEKLLLPALPSYEGSIILQETSGPVSPHHATASSLPAITPHAETSEAASSLVVPGMLTPRAPNSPQPYDPRPFQAASHPNGFAERDRYSEQRKR